MTALQTSDTLSAVPSSPNDEVVIWRYMDFTKFVGLLESSGLFFPVSQPLRRVEHLVLGISPAKKLAIYKRSLV